MAFLDTQVHKTADPLRETSSDLERPDVALQLSTWKTVQTDLRHQRIDHDNLSFYVPYSVDLRHGPTDAAASHCDIRSHDGVSSACQRWVGLSHIAGADISFYPNDQHKAVGCVVILEFPSMQIVYSACREVELNHPYIPTYLAFREAPLVLSLLEEVKQQHSHIYPQVLFIDGNGTLHPRLFGLACHVGVLADIPSIGVAKNFCALSSEGLTVKGIKQKSSELLKAPGDWFPIIGKSGTIFGGAVRGTKDASNPVFVSPGHRISLTSAVALTVLCCKYRVPEPVRVADAVSRDYIRHTLRKQGVPASTAMPAPAMTLNEEESDVKAPRALVPAHD
ncbi:hypothetical protein HDU85_005183 [Gaertneriomyces sp. JEL0708]|nr:hypothetical protein HDU85_005183 [Gaertneriomyces sp. JEL0708]